MASRGMTLLLRDVGRRIAEVRTERGWTQDEFAERVEVSVGYLRRIEGGHENLTLGSVAKLAGLLGVDAAELLTVPASREKKRGRPKKGIAKAAESGAEASEAQVGKVQANATRRR